MKDRQYHKDAITYNEEVAKVAERLGRTLKNEEVADWCKGIARHHRFHERRHRKVLRQMTAARKKPQADVETEQRQLDLADEINNALDRSKPTEESLLGNTDDIVKQQAEFAAEKENVA